MRYDPFLGQHLSIWKDQEKTPARRFFMENSAPVMFSSGSVRSGKTVGMALRIIAHCLAFPGARAGVFRYRASDLTRSTLLTFLGLIDPSWISGLDNRDLICTFKNGSTLSFSQAADVDSLGSREFSIIGVDEAVEVSEAVLTQLIARLSYKLARPADYRTMSESWQRFVDMELNTRALLLVCNPRGRSHYLYTRYVDPESRAPNCLFEKTNTIGNTSLEPAYVAQIIAGSLKNGKSHTLEEIEQWVKDCRAGKVKFESLSRYLTTDGQRLVLGEWVNSESSIFMFDEERHVVKGMDDQGVLRAFRPDDFDEVIAGLDWGFQNARTLVLGVKNVPGRLPVYTALDYYAGHRVTTEEHLRRSLEMCNVWKAARLYMPADQPQSIKVAEGMFTGFCFPETAKNAVLAGIGAVQSALNTNRLQFWERPNNDHYDLFLNEMTNYGWMLDRQGNQLDKPLKAADHFCFVAGTPVMVRPGVWAPIESLKVGDKVVSINGMETVEATANYLSSDLVSVKTSDGHKFTCTSDHPFFLANGDRVDAGLLKSGDVLYSDSLLWKTTLEPLSLYPSLAEDTASTRPVYTTWPAPLRVPGFTGTFGSFITAQYRKATRFITRMKTNWTIASETWNCFLSLNTWPYIKGLQKPKQRLLNLWIKSGILPQIGTVAKRAVHGTGSTLKPPSNATKSAFALIAARSSPQPCPAPSIAAITANLPTDDIYCPGNIVVTSVNKLQKTARVYSLAVTGVPVYFVGNVLTKNCDAIRYAIFSYEYSQGFRETPSFEDDLTQYRGDIEQRFVD